MCVICFLSLPTPRGVQATDQEVFEVESEEPLVKKKLAGYSGEPVLHTVTSMMAHRHVIIII